jgi:sec-independent protein translocase protein TatA
MGIPAPSELILILLIVVVVFGAKRIPEIMGGVAQGIKTFKKTIESDEAPTPPPSAQPSSAQPGEEARNRESSGQKSDPK